MGYRNLPKAIKDKLGIKDSPTKTTAYKAGWRTIGGKKCYFRSLYEIRYGRYLEFLKEKRQISDWFHEPKTFWFETIKRGHNNYKPDFLVIHLNGSEEWIECKGYMDAGSRVKIQRFNKFFPHLKLRIVEKDWYKANNKTLKALILDWE